MKLLHIIMRDPDIMRVESIFSSARYHGLEDPVFMMIDPGEKFDAPSEIDNTITDSEANGYYYTYGKPGRDDHVPGEAWLVSSREDAFLLFMKYSDKILLTLNLFQLKAVIGACKTMFTDKIDLVTMNKYIRFCHHQHILEKVIKDAKT